MPNLGLQDAEAVAAPTNLTLAWSTGAGATAAAFYTPVCPTGYGALGSVALFLVGKEPPTVASFPQLRCVKSKYLVPLAPAELKQVWSSKGSKHSPTGGSVWAPAPISCGHRRSPSNCRAMLDGELGATGGSPSSSLQVRFTATSTSFSGRIPPILSTKSPITLPHCPCTVVSAFSVMIGS